MGLGWRRGHFPRNGLASSVSASPGRFNMMIRETSMTAASTFVASDGGAYEIQMGRWSRRLAEPFLDFTGVANNEDVLDVGCGTGNLAFAVGARANVKSLKGLDYSSAYIDNAKKRNNHSHMWNGPPSKGFFQTTHPRERCGHMSGLSARHRPLASMWSAMRMANHISALYAQCERRPISPRDFVPVESSSGGAPRLCRLLRRSVRL
jgi:SAM-dependent methyltransferase